MSGCVVQLSLRQQLVVSCMLQILLCRQCIIACLVQLAFFMYEGPQYVAWHIVAARVCLSLALSPAPCLASLSPGLCPPNPLDSPFDKFGTFAAYYQKGAWTTPPHDHCHTGHSPNCCRRGRTLDRRMSNPVHVMSSYDLRLTWHPLNCCLGGRALDWCMSNPVHLMNSYGLRLRRNKGSDHQPGQYSRDRFKNILLIVRC